MENRASFLALVVFLAVLIALVVLRTPVPEQRVLVVTDAEWFEPSPEYRAATRKPTVTHRDGDWVEIKLDSGELSFEFDPKHLYGEPKQ